MGGAQRAYPVDCRGDTLRLGWDLSPGGDSGCRCLPPPTDSRPTLPVLATACQPLGPLPTDGMYSPSHMFNLPGLPWAAPALRLVGSGHCSQGFAQRRYPRYAPG